MIQLMNPPTTQKMFTQNLSNFRDLYNRYRIQVRISCHRQIAVNQIIFLVNHYFIVKIMRSKKLSADNFFSLQLKVKSLFCQGNKIAWGAAHPHTVSQKNSTLETSEPRRKQLFQRLTHAHKHTHTTSNF